MKKILIILIILISSVCEAKSKWGIKLSNIWSSRLYYCYSFIQDGNTYKLFNDKKELTNQITISNGLWVEISLNESDN